MLPLLLLLPLAQGLAPTEPLLVDVELPERPPGWLDRLEVGGHARARFEAWKGFQFDVDPGVADTDAFLLTRVVLDATLPLGERARAFLQVKGAWSTNRDLPGGTRPLDADPLDLQQAWAEVPLPGTDTVVRLGRTALSYGAQRLVSTLPWGNTLRAWDGAMVRWSDEEWDVDVFATYFVPVDFEEFNEADEDLGFHGMYASLDQGERRGLDLYALVLDRAEATYNGTSGSEERVTLGARSFRGPAPGTWDWDVEAAYQLGEVGDGDVSAHQLGAAVGRTWDLATRPRAWLGLDVGSGDDEPGGDVETFQQLFPLAHAYLGIADVFARQNVVDVSCGASVVLEGDVRAALAYHAFWLADADDALYGPGGAPVVPGGVGSSRWAAQELDAVVTAPLGDGWTLELGVAGVTGERAIELAGGDEDQLFAYAQLLRTL